MFYILLMLLNCGGSGGSSGSPSSSSSSFILPISGKHFLFPSPEATFNHMEDLSDIEIIFKGGDVGEEDRENYKRALSLSPMISGFEEFDFFIEDGNIYVPNPSKEEGDDNDEFLSVNISTSNNITAISTDYVIADKIVTYNTNIKKIGTINNEPYYSVSMSFKVPDGYKIVVSEETGNPQTIVEYNSDIKGVEEIIVTSNLKYTLREIEDDNDIVNIDFTLSERTPFNKSESDFALKTAALKRSDGQILNKSDLGNGMNVIFESVTKLIEDIIPNEIGDNSLNVETNNDFELPAARWDLGDNIRLERRYKGFIAHSQVIGVDNNNNDNDDIAELNISIMDYQFAFRNKSFHYVEIITTNNKAIKINNGKFEYSTDNDAFTEIKLLFTSDIEED